MPPEILLVTEDAAPHAPLYDALTRVGPLGPSAESVTAVCYPCALRVGGTPRPGSPYREGVCGLCGEPRFVFAPADFGLVLARPVGDDVGP
jgi:hypothetical protein